MTYLQIDNSKVAEAAATFDPTKPIYMLNLWKYRPTAKYLPEHSALAGAPCTGREAADRYRAALRKVLPPNVARFFMSVAVAEFVAPKGESWDDVAINYYESFEGFKKMVESKEYLETAQPHRLAALEDMRLIMCDKIEM